MPHIDLSKVKLNQKEKFYVVSKEFKNKTYWLILRDYRLGINFETLYHLSCNSEFTSTLTTPYKDYQEYEVDITNININATLDLYLDDVYSRYAYENNVDKRKFYRKPFLLEMLNEQMLAEVLDIILYRFK